MTNYPPMSDQGHVTHFNFWGGQPPMTHFQFWGPYDIFGTGEARHFKFGVQTERFNYYHMQDRLPRNWMSSGLHITYVIIS